MFTFQKLYYLRNIYRNCMKFKSLFALGAFFALNNSLFSQQDPQFTQFYFNKTFINPAAAGIHNNICVNLMNRYQWAGFEGSPLTNQLTVDAGLKNIIGHDVGVGLSVYNDRLGFFNHTGLRLAGAYGFQVGGTGRLRVGIDLGFMNTIVDGSKWQAPQTVLGDPLIPASGSGLTFNAGAGVYYQANNWYAGISASNIPGLRAKNVNITQARHMYIMGGYTFQGVGNPRLDINPNAIIKTDFKYIPSFDINCNIIWDKRYWGGLTYRFQDMISIGGGAVIWQTSKHNLTASYTYDLTTSRILRFSSGSHELLLKYCFVIELNQPSGGGFIVRDLGSRARRYAP